VFRVPEPELAHRIFLLRGLMLIGASAGLALALGLAVSPSAAWFALVPAGAGAGMAAFSVFEDRRRRR